MLDTVSPDPARKGGEAAPATIRAKAPGYERAASTLPARVPPRESAKTIEPENLGEAPDLRFADPIILEIRELWKLRQDMKRAEQRLTLQIRAICRRMVEGDKTEAARIYAAMLNGRAHPLAETALAATQWLLAARENPSQGAAALEKRLAKLAKVAPLWPWAAEVRGLGPLGLAKIYGECGDPGAYRSVAALWKRAGLAVIDGGRQRMVAGEAALAHGYAPERRAVFYVISDCVLKAQGKGETARRYRLIYDARKALERPRVETDGHAHNRAQRFMLKALLRDAWRAGRAAGDGGR